MSTRFDASLLTRPPRLLRALLPGCEWTGPRTTPAGAPALYLTFDDGPIPEETPWVLEQLAAYEAQALFFCVGQNLERYPDIARAALAAGHRLGNHTHRHRSAWSVSPIQYAQEVAECQAVLGELLMDSPQGAGPTAQAVTGKAQPLAGGPQLLFRPPYGLLTRSVLGPLRPQFRVILWSVLTQDYAPHLSPERCLRLTLAAVRPGDVLVFHDSQKASARLRFVLPRVLAHFAALGYRFPLL